MWSLPNWKQTLEWFTCGETANKSDPKKQQNIVENQRSQCCATAI